VSDQQAAEDITTDTSHKVRQKHANFNTQEKVEAFYSL
jgi:hypothetical protein